MNLDAKLFNIGLAILGIAFGAGGAVAMIRSRVITVEREIKEAKKEIRNRQTIEQCKNEHVHVDKNFSELKAQNKNLQQMVGDLGTEMRGLMETLHARIDSSMTILHSRIDDTLKEMIKAKAK